MLKKARLLTRPTLARLETPQGNPRPERRKKTGAASKGGPPYGAKSKQRGRNRNRRHPAPQSRNIRSAGSGGENRSNGGTSVEK
jgi:hypothetical protein